MKDQDIISSIQEGSKDVIKAFYLENRVGFITFLQKNTSIDLDDLEDIYQDAIIVLIENIQRGRLDALRSSLKTYLFSIGKFMAFKKKKSSLYVHEEVLSDLWIYEDESEHEEKERCISLIQSKIKELSESCQKILRMIYYEGKKAEDILRNENYANKDVIKSQKSRCMSHLKRLVYEGTKKTNHT